MDGEQWPGQLLSFVRTQRPTLHWRDVKVRTALFARAHL